MRRCCCSALILSAAVIAVWLAVPAGGQEDFRRGRGGRTSPSRAAQPAAPSRSGSTRAATVKPADTQDARQVHVEILFVEITKADAAAAKVKSPQLTGKTADVEKALAELKLHGQVKSLRRIKLSVLDGRRAMTQLGETKATVSSTMIGRGGRFGGGGAGAVARSYQMRSYGTMLSLTPAVEPAGSVVLDLQFEHSGPEGDDDSPKEPGETTSPGGSRTLTFRNTLRVPAGEYVTVASSTFQSKTGTTQILALATARADKKTEKPAAKRTAAEVKVFHLQRARAVDTTAVLEQILNKSGAAVTPQITPDPRTNALIITSSDPKSLLTIEALLRVLDAPAKAGK